MIVPLGQIELSVKNQHSANILFEGCLANVILMYGYSVRILIRGKQPCFKLARAAADLMSLFSFPYTNRGIPFISLFPFNEKNSIDY